MFDTIRHAPSAQELAAKFVAVVDAGSAADEAARLAKAAATWAAHSDAAIDDANEITAAATRARQAAERAELAATAAEAEEAARAAWAAMTTAQEADARISAAIVESLIECDPAVRG